VPEPHSFKSSAFEVEEVEAEDAEEDDEDDDDDDEEEEEEAEEEEEEEDLGRLLEADDDLDVRMVFEGDIIVVVVELESGRL
jgi:hypothetical protein